MLFLDQDISPLGMGCWPIGGAMFSGDQSLGYTNANDTDALRAIHAALASGITVFDTAAAYGAGHSERLLAEGLKMRPEAMVVTKIGIGIDEASRQISFDDMLPSEVMPAIDGCLRRLQRDRIDLLLWHPNETPVDKADAMFDVMDDAVAAGKIRAYGWSTDFSKSAAAMMQREHFKAVEHAMNVFFDAQRMQKVAHENSLTTLIRSPLAMGVLSGKYDADTSVPLDDIRASQEGWMEYFKDGRANPEFLAKLDAVRDLLTSDGRTLVQGALCWIWAKHPTNLPVPGARTAEQVEGLAGALGFGPLSQNIMVEIDTLIPRAPLDEPDRSR